MRLAANDFLYVDVHISARATKIGVLMKNKIRAAQRSNLTRGQGAMGKRKGRAQAAGVTGSLEKFHDLDCLAGTWSAAHAQEFARNTADLAGAAG